MDKTGKSDIMGILAPIAIILVIVFASQELFDFKVKDLFAVTDAEEKAKAEEVVESVLCPPGADPSNTMTVGPLKRMWNPTEAMAGTNSRVFKVSKQLDGSYAAFGSVNDEGNKDDSATMTVAGLDKIGIIYAYDNNTFYSRYIDFAAPCKPFSSGSYDSGKNQLIKNASSGITTTVKNSDTSLNNPGDGTNNESIGSGEYGYFDFDQIQTAEHEGISATDGGYYYLVIEQNGTLYDETKTKLGSLSIVSTPSFYTLSETDSVTTTFKVNGCPIPGDGTTMCQQNLGRLTVKAETGLNPPGNLTSVGDGWIRYTFIDAEWYLNTQTGAPEYGVEKNTDRTAAGHYGSAGTPMFLGVD